MSHNKNKTLKRQRQTNSLALSTYDLLSVSISQLWGVVVVVLVVVAVANLLITGVLHEQ